MWLRYLVLPISSVLWLELDWLARARWPRGGPVTSYRKKPTSSSSSFHISSFPSSNWVIN